MAKKVWTFELEDGSHTVELEHGYFSGKRTIRVDGKLMEQKTTNLFDIGGEYLFQIGGHSCAVYITTNLITFSYDLVVDGRSVQTGQQVSPFVLGLQTARIVQIGLLGAILVYIIILIVLPYIGFIPPFIRDDSFFVTLVAGIDGVIAIISIALGYFLPRWMIKWSKQKPQRLVYIHIMRGFFFELVAIFGLMLGIIIGAGWQITLPFFVVSAGTLVHTFPTEERWRQMLE